MQERVQDAFTLIEIMIVVAVIGVLTAIATPYYLQYRRNSQRSACIANLYALEHAIELRKINGEMDAPTMDQLCQPIGYIKGEPRCPADKSQPYDISGELPACPNVGKYPDHALPVR